MTSIAYGPGEDPLNALYTLMGALDEAALASALADWVAEWSDTRPDEDPDDGAADRPEPDMVLAGEADDAGDGAARASEHGAVDTGGCAKGPAPDCAADRGAAGPHPGSTTVNPAVSSMSTAALQALDAGETKTASQATPANTGDGNDQDEPNDVDPNDTDGPNDTDTDGTENGDADEAGDVDANDTDGPDDTDMDDTETGDIDESGDTDPVEPETNDDDDTGSADVQTGGLAALGYTVADATDSADADDTGSGGTDALADIAILLHLEELNAASQDPAPALSEDLADSSPLADGTDLTLYAASTDVPAPLEHDIW